MSKHRLWAGLSSIILAFTILGVSLAMAQTFGSIVRLTIATGLGVRDSENPSINADGTKIVFESESDFLGQGILNGQTEIWLYDTTTAKLDRITTASTEDRDSRFPELNADGTKIVFQSDSDFLGQNIPAGQNEIWLYDTTTVTFTRITTASEEDRDSEAPALSADGTKIVFQSDSDFLGQNIPAGQNEIWLYDTTTVTFTRITTASEEGRDSEGPAISADGTTIAFYSDSDFLDQNIRDNVFEIWVYNRQSTELERITVASGIGGRDSFLPSLNSDGTKVAFHSDSSFIGQGVPNDQFEVWLYDIPAAQFTRVTTGSDEERDSFTPQLNADGTKVVFYSDSAMFGSEVVLGQNEIWLFDTVPQTYTRLTEASDPDRSSFDPAISADGQTVVFESDSDFLNQNIPAEQSEIWLFPPGYQVYLPLVIKP